MPSSITLHNQSFPVGTQVFNIDTIPGSAKGFVLTVTRDSSWDAPGHLFDFITEGSADNGVTWEQLSANNMEGGPVGSFHGVPVTTVSYQIEWAAGPSGSFKKTNVRITLNTARAFTTPLVTLQAI